MKRVLYIVLVVLAAAGCGRNRFGHIDVAASEKALTQLKAGFAAVADSIPDGRAQFLLSQGVPVADILVFEGEVGDSLFDAPSVPYGYACEGLSAIPLDWAFSFAQSTIPFEASTWQTEAPAFIHDSVAQPV